METINDIVRKVAEEMLNTSMQDITAEVINGWATRLGDAATCEKSSQVGNEPMTLDEAIAHAEEAVNDTPCGQAHKQLADWLKELREIKNSNAAKMRRALERLREWVLMDLNENAFIADSSGNYMKLIEGTIKIADAALSDPPRNCDRFTDESDAQIEFLNDEYLISVTKDTMLEGDKFENWEEEMKSRYAKWLFAEAKGGSK